MKVFPELISVNKEELVNYPTKAFEGKIHVISKQQDVDSAVEYLSAKKMIGFDTETRPTFSKNHTNTVALLQLSDENEAFLFQLKKIGLPLNLVKLLENTTVAKVGVAVKDDIKGLKKIHNFDEGNFIELQSVAKQLHIEAMGLRTLTPVVLGFKISKRQQLSNWENDTLSGSQKLYAATDAWVSLKIYQQLRPYTL
ncbi:MAG: 3'-5' exonuclease domain-containing protein 2 [Bacteroidales bacterium]|nr:3'-5' exonuclease domain-containing protein 2 [Bacteroidales bacterium]